MNRELSKSIMTKFKLKNKFNKNPTIGNKIAYQKQRNHCVKLLRQTKRNYYNTLQTTNIIDNKKVFFLGFFMLLISRGRYDPRRTNLL